MNNVPMGQEPRLVSIVNRLAKLNMDAEEFTAVIHSKLSQMHQDGPNNAANAEQKPFASNGVMDDIDNLLDKYALIVSNLNVMVNQAQRII